MNENIADYWSATINAQSYSGMADFNPGQYFLSLLIVLAIILFLGALAYKAGWLKKQTIVPSEEDQIVFYSRFGNDQQLMIIRQKQEITCVILKGSKTQLYAPLKGIDFELQTARSKTTVSGKRTFQSVWSEILSRKKGKE